MFNRFPCMEGVELCDNEITMMISPFPLSISLCSFYHPSSFFSPSFIYRLEMTNHLPSLLISTDRYLPFSFLFSLQVGSLLPSTIFSFVSPEGAISLSLFSPFLLSSCLSPHWSVSSSLSLPFPVVFPSLAFHYFYSILNGEKVMIQWMRRRKEGRGKGEREGEGGEVDMTNGLVKREILNRLRYHSIPSSEGKRVVERVEREKRGRGYGSPFTRWPYFRIHLLSERKKVMVEKNEGRREKWLLVMLWLHFKYCKGDRGGRRENSHGREREEQWWKSLIRVSYESLRPDFLPLILSIPSSFS